jgi:hypothetical protein
MISPSQLAFNGNYRLVSQRNANLPLVDGREVLYVPFRELKNILPLRLTDATLSW